MFPRTRIVHKRTCTKGELHIEVRRLVDGEVSCLLADCVATPSRSLFLMLPFKSLRLALQSDCEAVDPRRPEGCSG